MTREVFKEKLGKLRYFNIVYKDPYNSQLCTRGYFDLQDCKLKKEYLLVSGYFDSRFAYSDIVGVYGKNVDFDSSITLGADPELFFVKDGVMIPSTEVIKEETNLVARDGFQLELHPTSNTCRQVVANYIGMGLRTAREMATRAGATISFSLSHVVDDKVWKQSGKDLKQFGCHPTTNVHEADFKRPNGMRVKFRAGGGHIHVGGLTLVEKNDLDTIVKLMDIIVGNTLVLLDRDPANITRRKNYGRAGEYRPKDYGLEYRVPSNFWLKHYVLWSLATGLIRNAMTVYRNGNAEELLSRFNMKKVRDAINNNDYMKAMENFTTYSSFLREKDTYFQVGVSSYNVDKFMQWVIQDEPLKKLMIKNDATILAHWCGISAVTAQGFERFIESL